MKSIQEVQFEQIALRMDKQFTIIESQKLSRKLREQEIILLQDKLKSLSIVLSKVEENLRKNMRSKKYNEYDLKLKLKNYNQQFQSLSERFKTFQRKLFLKKKQELMMHKNLTEEEKSNIKRQQKMYENLKNINKTAGQTQEIVGDTLGEVKRQGDQLNKMQDVMHEIEHQLTLTEQITKVIVNRELASKLILFILVFFLGFANVLVLFLKII